MRGWREKLGLGGQGDQQPALPDPAREQDRFTAGRLREEKDEETALLYLSQVPAVLPPLLSGIRRRTFDQI
ncbi:hypothetical protein KGQ71_04345, partial [Patescibacteria group bacterium]|nr:hypothetical protein [Patescibacteria group bacterium]